MADAPTIPELQASHPDGSPKSRFEMEQWLRESIPRVHWLRIIANRTFNLTNTVAWDMREIVLKHWILDEMIRRGLIHGEQLGVNAQNSNDETELRNFAQRLAHMIQTGQAVPPHHAEGVNMSAFTPPPPPVGVPNGQPQQQQAYPPGPPAPPQMQPPGPPGPPGYAPPPVPQPPGPPGPPAGFAPPAPPPQQQFAAPPQPMGPPGGYAQPPGPPGPPAGAPQMGPPMGPPGAPPPPPQQTAAPSTGGRRRGQKAEGAPTGAPPAAPVPPMGAGAPPGFAPAPMGPPQGGFAPLPPQGGVVAPPQVSNISQAPAPAPVQATVDLTPLLQRLDQLTGLVQTQAKQIELLSVGVVTTLRAMYQKAGPADLAVFLKELGVSPQ